MATILLVEDDPLVLMTTELALVDLGHTVVTVESGPAAVKLLKDEADRYDGLISDFNLGSDVTGQDVIEAMRKMRPNVPIVLASAFPDAVTNEWRWDNDVDLLIKPYRAQQLTETVEQMFATNRAPAKTEAEGALF